MFFSLPARRNGTLGELVYRLYHKPESFGIGEISILAEQLLFTAAHTDAIEKDILPALAQGYSVVLDRFWWSTWVYGVAGNLNKELLDLLTGIELNIWHAVKPDCVFLLRRKQPLTREHSAAKWKRLAALYEELCSRCQTNMSILEVDNEGTIDEAFQIIRRRIL